VVLPSGAVQEAVRDGELSEERLLSYIKLKKKPSMRVLTQNRLRQKS